MEWISVEEFEKRLNEREDTLCPPKVIVEIAHQTKNRKSTIDWTEAKMMFNVLKAQSKPFKTDDVLRSNGFTVTKANRSRLSEYLAQRSHYLRRVKGHLYMLVNRDTI